MSGRCRLVGLVALMIFAESARGEQWYGNLVVSGVHTKSTPVGATDGAQYQARANINVEDVLFYKNRMRLATNLDWRRDNDGYKAYRPIYYGDLYGYGYTFSTSYCPFRRKALLLWGTGAGTVIDVYTRDWRNTLQITPVGLPSLSAMFNRIRTYNNDTVKVNDQLQRTIMLQSEFSRGPYALRGHYQRFRTDDFGTGRMNDLVRTAGGNLSVATPASRVGGLSMTLDYFDTRRTLTGAPVNRGRTASVTALASSAYLKRVSTSLSYSGRFTRLTQVSYTGPASRNESVSASVMYAPTSYVDFQGVKGYQIDGTAGQYAVLEYSTLSANLSRSLRQGVDTRLSFTRSLFQRGNRVVEYRDSVGALDSIARIDHFFIDTWYGTVAADPVPYLKLTLGSSVSRDSHPLQPERRYQMSVSADARFWLRENMEGRLSYGTNYQGERFRIGHAFSETINIGGSFLPTKSTNVAVAYVHSTYNSLTRNTSSTLNLYASYAFRRIYNVSVSYNRQGQSQTEYQPISQSKPPAPPRTFNAQLSIHTTARSTLTIGYLRDRLPRSEFGQRTASTWQSNLNIQL